MSSAPHNNETYLEGILRGDKDVIRSIYMDFYPRVLKYIRARNGSEQEAEDVFATALAAIYQRLRGEPLELEKSFSAFLFGVCKNQWHNVFRKKKRETAVTDHTEQLLKDENTPDQVLEDELLQSYIRSVFRRLSKDCRQIIRMRWSGESYESIRQLMGYRSEGYARKRKHICYRRLQRLIAEDPRIRELFGDLGSEEP